MAGEQFSLCWDNFHKNMSNGMHALLENEDLVDVTIAVEGKYLKAHKMVLSVCSPYFKELFQTNPCNHPIVFMKDVSYLAMNDLLTFMYQGEVQVNQEHLTAFIKTAEALHVKGLTGDGGADTSDVIEEQPFQPEEVTIRPTLSDGKHRLPRKLVQPAVKRPRLSSGGSSRDHPAAEEIIQFKMEPCDPEQPAVHLGDEQPYENLLEEAHGDDGSYREVTVDEAHLDDANIDDPEDYSMLESEDDPKPGTSNDAEPQGMLKVVSEYVVPAKARKRRPSPQKVIHQGFVYHLRLQHHGKTRYFRCAKERYTGCMATAKLDGNASSENLTVIRPHNHPPDAIIEEKTIFENQLRRAVQSLTNLDIKSVYNSVAAIYPESAQHFPFGTRLNCKMKRWRRACLEA